MKMFHNFVYGKFFYVHINAMTCLINYEKLPKEIGKLNEKLKNIENQKKKTKINRTDEKKLTSHLEKKCQFCSI